MATDDLDIPMIEEEPKKKDLASTFKERISQMQETAKQNAEEKRARDAELKALREEAKREGEAARFETEKEKVYNEEFEKEKNKKSLTQIATGVVGGVGKLAGGAAGMMKQSAENRAASQGRPPPRAMPFRDTSQPQFNILGAGSMGTHVATSPTYPSILGSVKSKPLAILVSKKGNSNQFGFMAPTKGKAKPFSMFGKGGKSKMFKL